MRAMRTDGSSLFYTREGPGLLAWNFHGTSASKPRRLAHASPACPDVGRRAIDGRDGQAEREPGFSPSDTGRSERLSTSARISLSGYRR